MTQPYWPYWPLNVVSGIRPVYATVADLASGSWVTNLPDNVDAYLRIASSQVAWALRYSVYRVDATTGLPADAAVASAVRDAVCAQVAYWVAAQIDPTAAGVGKTTPAVISKSMGGRSVSYADLSSSVTIAQQRSDAARTLCDEALTILGAVGLLSSQPAAW